MSRHLWIFALAGVLSSALAACAATPITTDASGTGGSSADDAPSDEAPSDDADLGEDWDGNVAWEPAELDLTEPRATLEDGWEFVAVPSLFRTLPIGFYARRDSDWRFFLFDVHESCGVEEVTLPVVPAGGTLIPGDDALLICEAETCEVWTLETNSEFVLRGTLANAGASAVATTDRYDNYDMQDVCVLSASELRCLSEAGELRPALALTEPPSHLMISNAVCALFGDGTHSCLLDGAWAAGTTEGDQGTLPEPVCGGVLVAETVYWYDDYFRFEVSADGVISFVNRDDACTTRSGPLGTPVTFTASTCGIVYNVALTTATLLYGTCDCAVD